jgi:hypothetical protein
VGRRPQFHFLTDLFTPDKLMHLLIVTIVNLLASPRYKPVRWNNTSIFNLLTAYLANLYQLGRHVKNNFSLRNWWAEHWPVWETLSQPDTEAQADEQ